MPLTTSNRYEILSSPRAPKRKLQDSPPLSVKKACQGPPSPPPNPLMDDTNAELLSKLGSLGNCSATELNSIGQSLATLLNSFGEKLHGLAAENHRLNSKIESLLSDKIIAESNAKKTLDLKVRNETIVNLKSCASTITLCNNQLNDFPDRSAQGFVHSMSTSIARGLVKPTITSYKNKDNPKLANINIGCNSLHEKKIVEQDFIKNGLKNIRFNWPKSLVAPIQSIRSRFSTLRKNPILIRPHSSCSSLNVFEKVSKGWVFLENLNLPPRKGGFQVLSSKFIDTDNLFLTQS